MSRPKPPRWSVRFELRPEVSSEVKLHDYLDKLAESDEASRWIRDTLIAALPTIPESVPAGRPKPLERVFKPAPKPGKSPANGGSEPRYEAIED